MDSNDKNLSDADNMTLISQEMVFDQVGEKIKKDLLSGAAVVLFAYGLSGSGKTFTVFGPDASDAPEAWFKHKSPQPQWVCVCWHCITPLSLMYLCAPYLSVCLFFRASYRASHIICLR